MPATHRARRTYCARDVAHDDWPCSMRLCSFSCSTRSILTSNEGEGPACARSGSAVALLLSFVGAGDAISRRPAYRQRRVSAGVCCPRWRPIRQRRVGRGGYSIFIETAADFESRATKVPPLASRVFGPILIVGLWVNTGVSAEGGQVS